MRDAIRNELRIQSAAYGVLRGVGPANGEQNVLIHLQAKALSRQALSLYPNRVSNSGPTVHGIKVLGLECMASTARVSVAFRSKRNHLRPQTSMHQPLRGIKTHQG